MITNEAGFRTISTNTVWTQTDLLTGRVIIFCHWLTSFIYQLHCFCSPVDSPACSFPPFPVFVQNTVHPQHPTFAMYCRYQTDLYLNISSDHFTDVQFEPVLSLILFVSMSIHHSTISNWLCCAWIKAFKSRVLFVCVELVCDWLWRKYPSFRLYLGSCVFFIVDNIYSCVCSCIYLTISWVQTVC